MTTGMQDHFHLDIPGVLDTDGAPLAYYKARQRAPQPVAQTIVTTGWTGVRKRSTIVDESGSPVIHNDLKYRVVSTSAQFEAISNLLGYTVSVVDHYHPDVGEDHTAYVKPMALVSITDILGIGQSWLRVEFTIELQELS